MTPRNEVSPTCTATVSPRWWSSRTMSSRSRCRAHWRAAARAYSSSSARCSSRISPAAAPSCGSAASSSKGSSSVVIRAAPPEPVGGTVTPEAAMRWCSGVSSVLLDSLDLELEAGLLADQDASTLERSVPGQAEFLTVELGLGREAGALVPERTLRPAVVLDLQRHRPGNAMDGEVARDEKVVRRAPLDPRAAERDLRVALDVEEVGRAQVRVPLLVAALDAGRVDLDLDPRAQRVVGDVDVALHVGELAPDLAHHQMAGNELHARVDGVELPVARGRDFDAFDGANFGLAHCHSPPLWGKAFDPATVVQAMIFLATLPVGCRYGQG